MNNTTKRDRQADSAGVRTQEVIWSRPREVVTGSMLPHRPTAGGSVPLHGLAVRTGYTEGTVARWGWPATRVRAVGSGTPSWNRDILGQVAVCGPLRAVGGRGMEFVVQDPNGGHNRENSRGSITGVSNEGIWRWKELPRETVLLSLRCSHIFLHSLAEANSGEFRSLMKSWKNDAKLPFDSERL